MTETEKTLWEELRSNKILGLRFKPQHPVDVYIVDFYCRKLKLIIEIDGGVHLKTDQKEYDSGRTHELNSLGIEVLRFTNEQIISSLEKVIEEIMKVCNQCISNQQSESPL